MNNSLTRAGLEIGATIANTYTIEGLLGKGGMGSVFLCSHARLPGKQVAIKVLHTEVTNGDVLARFRREAEIASKLGHPNIVTVLDFNALDDGTPYLVLEYLVGESLWDRMRHGALSLEFALSLARQVGSALAAAHRDGIVHRDLKPHNIFLVATESQGRHSETAKVLDFGISKIRGSATVQTQENTMLGTPQYMSPEQAMGRQNDVDGRADQFALAVILHEILSGKSAFPGASIPEVVFKVVYEEPTPLLQSAPSTPPHVVAALVRAMRKNHTERFPTIEEFVQALTGEALASTRSGRKPIVTAPDALAMTIDSGNHGPAFGIANTTPAVQPTPFTGQSASSAASVLTNNPPAPVAAPAPSLAAAPSAVLTATTEPPGSAPRRRVPIFVFAAGGLACAALVGGLMVANDRAALFFGLIAPHGLLELTAVFVAAGAGMRLGWQWFNPGPRPRSVALAQEGRAAVAIALGLVVVLLVSGVIEAFVTPSGLPTWARVTVGVLALAGFLAYVAVYGRRAERAGFTGDLTVEGGATELAPMAG